MEISAESIPFPPVFTFFSFFLLIYHVGYFIIFKNWNPNFRPEAASCSISLCHGTPAAILAIFSLLSDSNLGFASPNTHFQKLVLEFSVAYFAMDLIHYLVFYPNDFLFIGHHLATLFVFLTCRYVVSHGAFAILVLLILAELTSFLQNVWTLSNARRFDADFAAKLYWFLSPPFYVMYTILRGFLGPFFVYKMGIFYLSGAADGLIPRWVWVSWISVVVTAISVSISWIWNRWIELFRERQGELKKVQ